MTEKEFYEMLKDIYDEGYVSGRDSCGRQFEDDCRNIVDLLISQIPFFSSTLPTDERLEI